MLHVIHILTSNYTPPFVSCTNYACGKLNQQCWSI